MMKTWHRVVLFAFIGLLLYAAVFYSVETRFVYGDPQENRFFQIKTLENSSYDYVILGSSHALPFDFEDMNEQLEQMTGSQILNLATAGGGIVLNRLLFEYFLKRHNTKNILYVLDSFALYSSEWNENRLNDSQLLQRAPFDLALAQLFFSYNFTGRASLGVTLDYLSGFSKLNNPHTANSTHVQMEKWFNRPPYKPSASERKERIERLYPGEIQPQAFDKYLTLFVDFIHFLKSQGIEVIVIKTPVPQVFYDMIPHEEEFNQRISGVLAGEGVPFYNFSLVNNDPKLFFDTDHLNRTGVMQFFADYFSPVLIEHRGND
ncbi:MAG: hypothetical protein A2Z21_06340 [Candidatus Fraserbacteria bacterium RBG_16_55_9]|uniref:DUF1574 domain-containing protein n=1 Tax=Fraserbacteria sp. (strain RBG_16_55_9) TaxID=1817864 RepID=A0A1F5UZW3_FRAXR|nr:MAG: hypothetical protein A2Z21_06340 [Candidatus Fraserbacteria bacterium RBG_16_55_9]